MDGHRSSGPARQWVTMSLLRLLQFRLEASGKVGWWFRPPWNRRRIVQRLDGLRLMRRHRGRIQFEERGRDRGKR